jgi:hypothetical protein
LIAEQRRRAFNKKNTPLYTFIENKERSFIVNNKSMEILNKQNHINKFTQPNIITGLSIVLGGGQGWRNGCEL